MEKRRAAIEHGTPPPLTLLAMGNPASSDASAPALPNSEHEVLQIRELYDAARSRVYVGTAATEKRFDDEAPRARFLHLAAHGVFDDRSPMHSYLLLSPGKEHEAGGLIEASDLMNAKLPEELTVLSACQTARGRYGAGEGVIGLTWAIFVAGCPASVVSQWDVDSASTTELMIAFHRTLSAAVRKHSPIHAAASLREAELQLLHGDAYRHPFYWAGFAVIGAGR